MSKNIFKEFLFKAIDMISKPKLFFFNLLWLMVLLFVGTVSQKTIGLYQAQEIFFSSWVIWLADFIPLPGTRLCLFILFMGLFVKMFKQKWRKENAGTIIVHLGALCLLFGGFLTAFFSQENYLLVAEGQSKSYIESYFEVELAVVNEDQGSEVVFDQSSLKKNKILSSSDIPFKIDVINFYKNVMPVRREAAREEPSHGMSVFIDLKEIPRNSEEELNNAGLEFKIIGLDESDGFYAVFKNMPIKQTLETVNNNYVIELRPARQKLPFEIVLIDFEKRSYPGTDKAKSYQSEVIVRDKDIDWPSLIKMNEPLRYKGYTFYQSSFLTDGKTEVSVFAVVENLGRLFPYISSIIICLGLLVHIFVQAPKLLGNRKHV
jgi:hypothetical protein